MRRSGLVDLRPLRASAPFRRLWVGSSLTGTGHQVVTVAVLFQVWQLTGSPVWTGAVGLATAIPMVVFGLVGGTLADAIDRRTIVRGTTIGQLAGTAGLAGQAIAGFDSVVLVLALVALNSAAMALGAPARRTFTMRLLSRDLVAAGLALQHLSFQAAMLVGPALAGLVIGQWGLAVAYAATALTFPVALYAVIRLPSLRPVTDTMQRAGLRSVIDGMRQIQRTRAVRGSFGVDLFATLLAMPVALFPMVNEIRFEGRPETLGLFLTAVAAGGILAGLWSGLVTRADRLGLIQLWAAGVWCVALACFGLVGPLWLALLALGTAGAADTFAVIARAAVVQHATPDSHRGRVSAAEHVIGTAGPNLGNARAGLVAGVTSATFALASGGLAALAGVFWIAMRNRELRRFRVSAFGQIPSGDDRARAGLSAVD